MYFTPPPYFVLVRGTQQIYLSERCLQDPELLVRRREVDFGTWAAVACVYVPEVDVVGSASTDVDLRRACKGGVARVFEMRPGEGVVDGCDVRERGGKRWHRCVGRKKPEADNINEGQKSTGGFRVVSNDPQRKPRSI